MKIYEKYLNEKKASKVLKSDKFAITDIINGIQGLEHGENSDIISSEIEKIRKTTDKIMKKLRYK